ncbi:MAG TPA: prolyl oligopeptidase family serine peptidase [Tepidisphaeraceae bacterium]|nr:prolyl oligopeptidase family serine peptidase [Tepidisphaeraceae bacterium]
MQTAAIALAFLILSSTLARALDADKPPVAPVRPVVDDHDGTKVTDPYRYMEKMTDPDVAAWVKAQADYARRTLEAIPGRDALLARIAELDAGAPYRIHVLRRWADGRVLYYKTLATENLEKLYLRDAAGTERLLVDPEKLTSDAKAKGHLSLSFAAPSPDLKYIAFGVAAAGSEQTELRLLDVASATETGLRIKLVEHDYTWPSWLPDSSGFAYSRKRDLPKDAPDTEGYKRTAAYFHKIGEPAGHDRRIFAMESAEGPGGVVGPRMPGVDIGDTDFPSVVCPLASDWIIGKVKHGDTNELTLYAAPRAALAKAEPIPWTKVCGPADEVHDFAVRGDEIFLLAMRNAPRGRVLRVALTAPSLTTAPEVIAPGQRVLRSLSVARDALYVNALDGGPARVIRVPFDDGARPADVPLPEGNSSAFAVGAVADLAGTFVSTESWTRAGRIYALDPATGTLTDTKLRPRGAFDDPDGWTSEELLVPSHDGVKVPLSILYKRGLKRDGSAPTLVTGYGGYGMVTSPAFRATYAAWLERGGVLAWAHVRGGGEFGKEWHHAGRMATKPNTWKDFVACAQYLVDHKYTSPEKLAGSGGSAGGILIGRAITTRPDLFRAAIIQVGCTDMIRMETTTNGVPNIAEFGTVKTPAGFKALLEMSALHHVTDGVKYPAVLLTHGINDPRVEPWMSAKMTARLQAATASGRPVLFRVEYDGGHGIGSTKRQRHAAQADGWAFLMWQFGNAK